MTIFPKELRDRLKDLLTASPSVKLITLEGEHGSGKDLYASLLAELGKPLNAKILRFADPARRDFREAGIPERDLDVLKRYGCRFTDPLEIGGYSVQGMTTREALIHITETNKSQYGEYLYANQLLNRIGYYTKYEACRAIIIPDLRFDPEREALKNLCREAPIEWISLKIPEDLPELTMI